MADDMMTGRHVQPIDDAASGNSAPAVSDRHTRELADALRSRDEAHAVADHYRDVARELAEWVRDVALAGRTPDQRRTARELIHMAGVTLPP